MKVLAASITFAACALALMAGCGNADAQGPGDVQDAAQDVAVAVDTTADTTTDAKDTHGDSDGYLDAGADTTDVKADETSAADADIVCALAGSDGSCAIAWDCIRDCEDQPSAECTPNCVGQLSAAGQEAYGPLSDCIQEHCPGLTGIYEKLACAAEKCPDEYAACFDPCGAGN